MKYIKRTLEQELRQMQQSFGIIMVTGARQCGKSTLLRQLARQQDSRVHYVTLDDWRWRRLALEEPEKLVYQLPTPLIIDEFQYAPELLSYLKIRVDEAKEKALLENKQIQTWYYLTGSQVFQTMAKVSESLAGRVGVLDLYPLSSAEIERVEERVFVPDIKRWRAQPAVEPMSSQALVERLWRGSYPELYSNPALRCERFYSEYVQTYLERDVREIMQVKDENVFYKFIASLACRTGQEYNGTDIARDVGVDHKTLERWLSVLKNTQLVYFLQSYANNNVQKVIKRPKVYFMDTGLACYLAGIPDAAALSRSEYLGRIFETYVISEIVKSYTNHGQDPRQHLFYYRDHYQREIDLLVVAGRRVYPVEIKWTSEVSAGDAKNFRLVEQMPYQAGEGVIVYGGDYLRPLGEKTWAVPVEYIGK